MLTIHCRGNPYMIGREHGSQGKQQVLNSIAFYTNLFLKTCALAWPDVQHAAAAYVPTLERLCPDYLEEIRGLAAGAGVDVLDILALNVRTEIMFGQWAEDPDLPVTSDGCTAIACRGSDGKMLLAQNWDWQVEQTDALITLEIERPGKPAISMITEGGVIGKIGLNDKGVGVCLNAIRARGVDSSKMPIHLALRAALESNSAKQAVELVKSVGTAGSGHILVADASEATGLECTYITVKALSLDSDDMIVHTNHLLLEHPNVDEPLWLVDSRPRVVRFHQLAKRAKKEDELNALTLAGLFQDEEGYPRSVNRRQVDGCDTQTLFNIIMSLDERKAAVAFGRPTDVHERTILVPNKEMKC